MKTISWNRRLSFAALAAASIPVVVFAASMAYAALCQHDARPNPEDVECNDSFLRCEDCSEINCLAIGTCFGEQLQPGKFGSIYSEGDECKQDGPAAMCKKKYHCRWDAQQKKCVVDAMQFIQGSGKATVRSGCN